MARRTGVSLPVEVITRVAMALELKSHIVTSRTMGKWNMVVCNVVEEMNLIFSE